MSSKKQKIGIGMSLFAAGLGYLYRALVQERSLKSQVLQDKRKITKSLQKTKTKQQQIAVIADRIEKASQEALPNDVSARFNIHVKTLKAGTLYQLNRSKQVKEHQHLVYYFHDGKRIDTVTSQEWAWIAQLSEQVQGAIQVPYRKPLTRATLKEEVTRLVQVIKEDSAEDAFSPITFVATDAGAFYALLAAQDLYKEIEIKQIILLSPWLNAEISYTNKNKTISKDYDQDEQELCYISELWQQYEPLLNLVDMNLTTLPEIVIIGGTEDLHESTTYQFYQRLRQENKPVKYYRFDNMAHTFYLDQTTEADEVMGIIMKHICS